MPTLSRTKKLLPYLICIIFFLAYATLSVIRHNHYQSFGFDLGVTDQIVWEYSHFDAPITTVHYYPYTSILTDHVEFIYAPLSIFYWIWDDPRMLLLVQAAAICLAGLPLYFLAIEKKVKPLIAYAILLSYLTFYGLQNALWFDVHSEVFGASFIPWFIYFLDKKKLSWSALFFFLTIISKENMAFLTFLISIVYFIKRRSKQDLIFISLSVLYSFIIFFIYFPHFTKMGYEYASSNGLLGDIDLRNFVNTNNKQQVLLYSLGWYGSLPFLSPLSLIPFIGDLFSYFVIGNNIKEADGLFMHYRVSLDGLLAWSTIVAIAKFKWLNRWYVALYLFVLVLFFQFTLHLPLSYLSKHWFWQQPAAVTNINTLITYLPTDASVVSQNNITPHIDHRKNIFTLWPGTKDFKHNSPCGKETCDWLSWRGGKPTYIIVDTSTDWDIRHLLIDRPVFLKALSNMEKEGEIIKDKQVGNAILYKINYKKLLN
ncbi:MAG TPA: DUF2079 domain-containing protein [Candidatus Saccharimonadales bacterium]|nr:DUF2079 domain-containing protein [Candidatus Saccharimonadales bacterium]